MASGGVLTTDELRCLRDRLAIDDDSLDAAEAIERVRLFEEIKAATVAAQAKTAVHFEVAERARLAGEGVPAKRQGRGVASQVALARRVGPAQAQHWLGNARILIRELPRTFAELAAGRTSEKRAWAVARETGFLSRDQRGDVDRELALHLEGWGDRRVEAEARKAAYRADPAGLVERRRRAEADRFVSVRPAPDAMVRLTALLPVAQGVACYAALKREVDVHPNPERLGQGQLTADLLVERLTGQTAASAVPVEINLVMAAQTLLARPGDEGHDEPAHLDGYGPVPASLARDLAYRGTAQARRWIRRLYTKAGSGELVAMETRRRVFTDGQQRFLRLRDQTCRTPWCDAPIRHADHIHPWYEHGPTAIANGQGLCQTCNLAKEAPGWRARPGAGGLIVTRTPTGHRYRSRAPSLPGGRADPQLVWTDEPAVQRRLQLYFDLAA